MIKTLESFFVKRFYKETQKTARNLPMSHTDAVYSHLHTLKTACIDMPAMGKRFIQVLTFVCIFWLVMACDDKGAESITPALKLSRSAWYMKLPDATTDTLRIVSNTAWTITSDQSWLTVSPASGTGNATVTVTAAPYNGLVKRKATLSCTAATLLETSVVTQYPRVQVVAGGNGIGSELNQLRTPSTVFVDANTNLYITDQWNDRVVKWTPNATQGIVVAGGKGPGDGLGQLRSPYGIVIANGAMIIADNVNNRVLKWIEGQSSGTVIAGGNGIGSAPNQTSAPCSVFVDNNSNLYVCEAATSRVSIWPAGATIGKEFTVRQSSHAVFMDANGNIFLSSTFFNDVTKWAPGATAGVVVAGGNGRGSALNQFNDPGGIFVDADGNIYVTDQGNDRVMKWTPGATTGVVVAAGNGREGDFDQLNSPSALWLDASGNIYVSDQGNHRIMKWLKN